MYESVLRSVLWGDGHDEIIHRLEVNRITGTEADKIYQRAMSERVAAIRRVYWRRIVLGLIFMITGTALLVGVYYLTEGFRVYSILAIVLPAAPAVFGTWKLLDGVAGVLTASSRTGPISEIY